VEASGGDGSADAGWAASASLMIERGREREEEKDELY
jgi:hypothetical protein